MSVRRIVKSISIKNEEKGGSKGYNDLDTKMQSTTDNIDTIKDKLKIVSINKINIKKIVAE